MENVDEKKFSPVKRVGNFLCSLGLYEWTGHVAKKLLGRRSSNIQPSGINSGLTDKDSPVEMAITTATLIAVGSWVILSIANPSALTVDFFIAINCVVSITFFSCSLWTKQKNFIHPTTVLITTFLRWILGIVIVLITLTKEPSGLIIRTSETALGGNLAIGLILFLAISISLPVIGRAAERIAEVYSRFALDSMPGKQMSIDSELNCGLITPTEAKIKRKELERDNLQCASMEGVCKFAKWDAVAVSAVSIIGIIASMKIGLPHGNIVDLNATNKYFPILIGWFWGSQAPAAIILASIPLALTRAAYSNDNNLLDKSKAAILAGVAGILLGLIPGMPWFVISMGLLLCFGGIGLILRRRTPAVLVEDEQIPEQTQEQSNTQTAPEEMYKLLGVDALSLHVGSNLIELVDPSIGGRLLEEISVLREYLTLTFGYILPAIRTCDSRLIGPCEYRVILRGNTVGRSEVYPQHYMILKSHWEKSFPTAPKEALTGWEPNLKEHAYWLQKDYLDGLIKDKTWNKPYLTPFQVIIYHLSETVFLNMEELLTKANVRRILDQVCESDPQLVEDLIPSLLSVGDLRKILINLLKERVSVRDINYILERLEEFGHTVRDIDLLSEKIRMCLSRQLCEQHSTDSTIIAIDLCPDIQKQMEESLQRIDDKFVLIMKPDQAKRVIGKIVEYTSEIYNQLEERPIVLCNPEIRLPLARMIQKFHTQIVVMSYLEISTDFKVNILETVKLESLS